MKTKNNNKNVCKIHNFYLNDMVGHKKIVKDSQKQARIHFVGIGGVSVSSLAVFALNCGFCVTGSDICKTTLTTNLENYGIKIFYSHNQTNVVGANMLVFSNACENSEEVTFAKQNNIPVLTRAQFLSKILERFENVICVAGAHGKTTTTALIFETLKTAGKNPSLHLGGNLLSIGKNFEYGTGKYIVCEACEYKNSFLEFAPTVGVVLNIAEEHLDYFKTFENVKKSFNIFAKKSKNLVINCNCNMEHNKKQTFGKTNANFTARNIELQPSGKYSFDCYFNNSFSAHIKLNLIGEHNIENALASIAVCHCLGIDKKHIVNALDNFLGVERRYQFLHKTKFIVHDYAHHPDEIDATIKETLKFYKEKLLVVFQPHTYSRTQTLMKRFVEVFENVETLIIPTYSAREKYNYKGSAILLSKKIKSSTYIKNRQEAEQFILDCVGNNYGVLFLGAGDIYDMAKNVAQKC